MSLSITLTVNGAQRAVELDDPRVTLLDLLRERLGLTGTKKGCDRGQCGACTVLLDGQVIKSCTTLAVQVDGASLTTIEGLAPRGALHPVQQAFWEEHGLQCGYCTPGMVLSAYALLQENPAPDELTIRHALEGNLCRCTGYHNIVRSVQAAAAKLAAGAQPEP